MGFDTDLRAIVLSKFQNILATYEDHEDFYQEIYTKIVIQKCIEKFNPERDVKFSTFMFRVIHNICLGIYSHNNKLKRLVLTQAKSLSETTSASSNITLEDVLIDTKPFDLETLEKLQLVKEIMSTKKHKRRFDCDRLLDSISRGFSDTEIAREWGVSVTHIGNHRQFVIDNCKDVVNG